MNTTKKQSEANGRTKRGSGTEQTAKRKRARAPANAEQDHKEGSPTTQVVQPVDGPSSEEPSAAAARTQARLTLGLGHFLRLILGGS